MTRRVPVWGWTVRTMLVVSSLVAAGAALSLSEEQGEECSRLRTAFAVPAHAPDLWVKIVRSALLEDGGEPEVVFLGNLHDDWRKNEVRVLTFDEENRPGDRLLFTIPVGGPRPWLRDLFAGDFDEDGDVDILVAWGSSRSGEPRGYYELFLRTPSGEYSAAEPFPTR